MRVRLVSYPGASSYELRWAPVPAGGVPSAWISQPITNVRSATTISGLTPGMRSTRSRLVRLSNPVIRIMAIP